MVAITVILAAVIATFVMNMGPSESTPANANWDMDTGIDGDTDKYIQLIHEGGGAAAAGEYVLSFDNGDEIALTASNGGYSGGGDLSASDTFRVHNSSSDTGISGSNKVQLDNDDVTDINEVQLIWEDPEGDQTQIIKTWEPDA